MPAEDRVWLDEDQGLSPIPPGVSEQDPKESVTRAKSWAFGSALQSGQLLTKRQVLQSNGSVTRADQADCTEEDHDRRQHGLSCRGFSDRLNRLGRRSHCGEGQQEQAPMTGAMASRSMIPVKL